MLVLGVLCAIIAAPILCHGETIRVDAQAGVNTGTCGSVVSPCKTLDFALQQFSTNASGLCIEVMPGSYMVPQSGFSQIYHDLSVVGLSGVANDVVLLTPDGSFAFDLSAQHLAFSS
jgi:hypothetical protein